MGEAVLGQERCCDMEKAVVGGRCGDSCGSWLVVAAPGGMKVEDDAG